MTNRTFHPYVLMLFVVTWVLCLVVVQPIVLQVCLLLSMFTFLWRMSAVRGEVLSIVRFSVPFIILYTVIAASFGHPILGEHILWQGPTIRSLTTLAISTESLSRALTHALRTWNLLLVMFSFGRLIRPEVIVELMGKRFARVALTISMVISFIPNLLAERQRIVEVLRVRGGGVMGKRTSRVRAQIVVYQTLLMNALDRSFQLAESMMLRGYGAPRRTFYYFSRWRRQDTILFVVLLLFIGVQVCVVLAANQMWWSPLATFAMCGTLLTIGGRTNVPH